LNVVRLNVVRGLVRSVADVAICAAVPPAMRASLTSWCYSHAGRDYKPGAGPFEDGLHDWEAAALDAAPFPRAGHLLLGGAGGGRELRPILERGFTVTAFEPSQLWRAAREVGGTRARVMQGSYSDLVRAVTEHEGPLRSIADERFDGIVLGWGSLTHVIDADERRALFTALRRVGPSAPVLLSFQLIGSAYYGDAWLRGWLHRVLRRIGAPGEPCPPGLHFTRRAGFIYQFSATELDALAAETGYAVARFTPQWYSHAVWVPSGEGHEVTRFARATN
jgi:hypothetical protein